MANVKVFCGQMDKQTFCLQKNLTFHKELRPL